MFYNHISFHDPLLKLLRITAVFAFLLVAVLAVTSIQADDISRPFSVYTGCSNILQIPASECEILVKFYHATNGPTKWKERPGWLEYAEGCNWYGVNCINGRVSEIVLTANRLTGTLIPELGQLTSLKLLILDINDLSGPIPPELGNLTNLEKLILSRNELSGSIPATLGNLLNMKELRLDLNELSGPIPSALGNLKQMDALVLGYNNLSGTIPPTLGSLPALRHLFIHENELTGTIPPELGQLSNLSALRLDSNQLTGSIPATFGNLDNLGQAQFSRNLLSGPLPPQLGDMAKINNLRLDYNNFSGQLPPELGNATLLQELILNFNDLSGPIPPELGQLSDLRVLVMAYNGLSGPIPPELGQLSNLRALQLNGNDLSGEIPEALTNLTQLNDLELMHNRLISTNPVVLDFLAVEDPAWHLTQTIPPVGLTANINGAGELVIDWSLIPYTGNQGSYEVACDTTSGGPYDDYILMTTDKLTTTVTFSGIDSNTYFCAIRTKTLKHANNPDNDLLSVFSDEISAFVPPLPEPPNDVIANAANIDEDRVVFFNANAQNAGVASGGVLPAPSCAPKVKPNKTRVLFYELPAGDKGPLVGVAGGPPNFRVRDGEPLKPLVTIYRKNGSSLTEVACTQARPGEDFARFGLMDLGSTNYIVAVWILNTSATVNGAVIEFVRDSTQPLNGGFDVDADRNRQPDGWAGTNLTGDKLFCDNTATKFASSAPCAFQFKGSKFENSRLIKRVDPAVVAGLGAGSSFVMNAKVIRNKVVADTATLSVIIRYTNGTKESLVIEVPGGDSFKDKAGNFIYELYESVPFTLTAVPKRITVNLNYRGPKGSWLRLDDVQVVFLGAGLGGIALPAPSGTAPDGGMRGSSGQ